ncbi:biopolymer transporter ExbD [Parvularcula flava]|uniref:Biopolymer transporter ExbD n=1 Tax=Aquisalinus luteolus TaxID=1566827 RepID=A0A8J3ES16_9PROT|nr:biopolymer transporter ExbD [Aquisalinus luteolus]NHK29549.1 biopolymer transporter ExbD [Aquisalinus luteolus]GGI01604.1 biopolymer transporter ExbD [Aquisalinus luteolus]
MRRRFGSQNDETEVNVTPLLDIVFIMLIFFIVTATFVYEDGFNPQTPEDTPPDENTVPPPSLLLYVQADGFVAVDDARIIDPGSTQPVVSEFFASNPNGVVIVSAAPQSKVGVAVTVYDEAMQAGRSVGTTSVTITKSSE